MERYFDDDLLAEHHKDTTQMWVKYEDCMREVDRAKQDAQAALDAERAKVRELIEAATKEPINEPVTYEALAGARAVARRAFNELTKITNRHRMLEQQLDLEREKVKE